MTAFIQLALGGVLLYFGAEWLVRGAARLAASFGMPQVLVGLTVVAYGTSAPELVVGLGAGFAGQSGIALGNAVGSNIANLGLILGLTALIAPCAVDPAIIRREVPVLIATSLLVPLALWDGRIARWEGVALLVLAFGYTVHMVRTTRRNAMPAASSTSAEAVADIASAASGTEPDDHAPGARRRAALLAITGLVLLVAGGKVFVDGAVGIARLLGLSERLIGLTIVAVGTSLPELATSLIAARRGHAGIAVGNVVGSNIFNVLLILGASSLPHPIEANLASLRADIAFLIGMTLLGALTMITDRRVSRTEGGLLVLGYLVFLAALAAA